MEGPHPGRSASLITDSPVPGKYDNVGTLLVDIPKGERLLRCDKPPCIGITHYFKICISLHNAVRNNKQFCYCIRIFPVLLFHSIF